MKTDRNEVVRIATIMQRLGTYPMVPPDILLARAKDGGDLILELLAEKEAADAVIAETHNELARTYTRAYAAEAARDASQAALSREENEHAELQSRCFDNGQPSFGSIFDEVKELRADAARYRYVRAQRDTCIGSAWILPVDAPVVNTPGDWQMTDLRNDLARARDAWLLSDDGKRMRDTSILKNSQSYVYLKNRLEAAFVAGWNAKEKSGG